MSKPFVAPDWSGCTVLIVGNAPNMTRDIVDALRAGGAKVVACNRAVQFAPDADLFIALDPEHHADLSAEFPGERVIGIDIEGDDSASYAGMMYRRVVFGAGDEVDIRNNLLAALELAGRANPAKILLVGVDTRAYETQHSFRGVTEGLAALITELSERAIPVEFGPGGAVAIASEPGDAAIEMTSERRRGRRAPELTDENIGDA